MSRSLKCHADSGVIPKLRTSEVARGAEANKWGAELEDGVKQEHCRVLSL